MWTAAGLISRPQLFGAVLALISASAIHAGSFTANPVKLTLAPGAMSTSLLLENTGDQPVLVQAELMLWSQQDGKDILSPSQDLVVSPPIFTVAPGASQTVRLGLLRPGAADRETTYRLFLQEVPRSRAAGEQGVSVALRLGLPVFVLPRGRVEPQFVWRAKFERGDIRLSLSNVGNVHVQAVDCKLYRVDGTLIAEQQLGAYILAGQNHSWQIKPSQPWRGEKLKLTARMDDSDVTADIIPD